MSHGVHAEPGIADVLRHVRVRSGAQTEDVARTRLPAADEMVAAMLRTRKIVQSAVSIYFLYTYAYLYIYFIYSISPLPNALGNVGVSKRRLARNERETGRCLSLQQDLVTPSYDYHH